MALVEGQLMPVFYGINIKTDWKFIGLALFGVLLAFNLLFSVYPLLEANRTTIIKETSPTEFAIEQTVKTKPRAKTCTLDARDNRIILIATEPMPGRPGGAGPSFLDIISVGR